MKSLLITILMGLLTGCAVKSKRTFQEPIYVFNSKSCTFIDKFHDSSIGCEKAEGFYAMNEKALEKLLSVYVGGDE